jgi:peptidyl-prolyl cis-trans isomerase C
MRKLLLTMMLALPLLVACGGGTEDGESSAAEGAGDVLATIAGKDITRGDLDAELEKIPPFQRQEFETPKGRAQFLERMLDMEALYSAATEAGMEKDQDVLDELEYARRQIMMKHFYKKHIEEMAAPEEEQVTGYYENNLEQFAEKDKVKARMILAENAASAEALRSRIQGGEDFVDLAGTENLDGSLKNEKGDLGWFTEDGYVRSVGVNKEFTGKVFQLNSGDVGGPYEIKDKGWALVKVEEKQAAYQKDLEEVREEIERRLLPQVREEFYKKRLRELREQYGATVISDALDEIGSPEELFQLAQDTRDPQERIGFYKKLVEKFGDSEQADRAQFMIGFVYSEELQDSTNAKASFENFLTLYPNSDLAKDAEYMIRALSGEVQELEP